MVLFCKMSGVEDEETPSSPNGSANQSKKVKILCSHGGKILPRPSDGHLKYVGGQTRVVSVPRHITFSELKDRLSEMAEGETVLKYQIIPEEMDILVSVKNDEDVKHMIHEYDRIINTATSHSPKLRTFLFSPNNHSHSHSHSHSLSINMHRVHSWD